MIGTEVSLTDWRRTGSAAVEEVAKRKTVRSSSDQVDKLPLLQPLELSLLADRCLWRRQHVGTLLSPLVANHGSPRDL